MKPTIEVNSKFIKAKDELSTAGGALLITPPLNEDYWVYRVPLKHKQAIVVFPKFGTLGCGFAQEKDWNTNLPISCEAKEIFRHIKHNKKYKDITDIQCIEAIQNLKDFIDRKQAG